MKLNLLQKRVLTGLLIALIAALSLEYWAFTKASEIEFRNRTERVGVISLQSLLRLVVNSGAGGEDLQSAVEYLDEKNPQISQIRVVKGARLEASTVSHDRDDLAAPRRLKREEKWIYDLGKELQAAVQINEQEGVKRKNEMDIRPADGALLLSAPLEIDGTVVGLVQAQAPQPPPPPKPSLLPPIFALVIALLLFWFLSKFFEGSRVALVTLALFLLLATVTGYGWLAQQTLNRQFIETQNAVVEQIRTEIKIADSALAALGVTKPTQRQAWDVDAFRNSRGFINPDVSINRQRVDAELRNNLSRNFRILGGILAVSILVLLFLGLGIAVALLQTLIRFRQAYAYSLPAMIGMLVLVFLPFAYGIALAFTNSTLYNTDKSILETWIGMQNFKEILGNFSVVRKTAAGWFFNYQNFYWTLFFTVVWTISNVTIGVTVGLILALILNTKGLALRPFYRVLLILPWAVPNYITALIWRGMFHQQFGVINQILQIFGGQPLAWFDKPTTSFLAVLSTNGWLSFPFMMVISLGALQSIPAELYEAARVDGATRWQQFRSITLPSLKPALVPAIILSVIWTFNMFNIIYLVSGGEPAGSTEILITQAYKIAFEKYRYGYAAAYSTVIFLILLFYGNLQNRVTRATEAITA